MERLLETLSQKEIFIMPPGRAQQEFEYIFTDFNICGYINENISKSCYNGRPVKSLNATAQVENSFIIVCKEKNQERQSSLEGEGYKYKTDFCFAEDLFFLLDYDLQQSAGKRDIVICEEDDRFIHRKPDLLLDGNKYGESLYGMEILNPAEFEDWKDYCVIVTMDQPAEIFSMLEMKGLSRDKDYAWYQELHTHSLPSDKKIAYYGCGYVASEIIKRNQRRIARRITPDELKTCNKKEHYVVLTGAVFDKFPVLAAKGYKEIKDFVHWRYIDRMEALRPSELLKQTMAAPMIGQSHCKSPFEFVCVMTDGEAYGCVSPGWTQWGFGNIKYQTCHDVWNSIHAKIFRLSILNRTFSFCKENYCYECDPQNKVVNDTDIQLEHDTCLYPRTVKPCIDYSCNLFCESCRQTPQVAKGEDLNEERFLAQRLIESEWLEHAENLNIAGMGEVFYSEIYRKLLYDEVDQKRNTIQIFSNGNLFTRMEFEKLLQCYQSVEVEISIDAATKRTYEKLRRGGDWNKLMQNLGDLGEERIRGHMASFTINMIVQKENYQEIPEFIKLGKKIHADVIAIRPLTNWGTYSDEEYQEISMISHKNNWISEELKEVMRNPLLKESEVDYTWFQKRM